MSRASWQGWSLVLATVFVAIAVVVAGFRMDLWPTARKTPPMPKPLEEMVGDEFRTHVQQLVFSGRRGSTRARTACRTGNGPACTDTTSTTVEISAEKGSGKVGPGNMDSRGHIVALLANTGGALERRYQLPARTDSIFWLVEPGQSTTEGRSRFVRLLADGGWEVIGEPHQYVRCRHRYGKPIVTTADFRECVSTGPTPLGFQAVATQEIRSAWVSCIEGCCIAR